MFKKIFQEKETLNTFFFPKITGTHLWGVMGGGGHKDKNSLVAQDSFLGGGFSRFGNMGPVIGTLKKWGRRFSNHPCGKKKPQQCFQRGGKISLRGLDENLGFYKDVCLTRKIFHFFHTGNLLFCIKFSFPPPSFMGGFEYG